MDWFSWLSKTCLGPSLVYEYGLVFEQNELEKDDISYFNHEFLQSMGISIAKHRLEILKLARKDKERIPHPLSRLFISINQKKTTLSNNFRPWICREESALAIVPSTKWKNGVVKKNKRLIVPSYKQSRAPLLAAKGNSMFMPSSSNNRFSCSIVHDFPRDDQKLDEDHDGYWSCLLEEMKSESMIQNLKPT